MPGRKRAPVGAARRSPVRRRGGCSSVAQAAHDAPIGEDAIAARDARTARDARIGAPSATLLAASETDPLCPVMNVACEGPRDDDPGPTRWRRSGS
jgi:hypothetical protein